MYYRRKILLALLELFGGNLKRTDCEKLLFKFCKTTGKEFYDFIPYQYGPFSFISYLDKRRLTQLGLLKKVDDFQLNTDHSYLNELEPDDKTALLSFKVRIGDLRGNRLLKMIYQEYPQYTIQSQIVDELFETEEVKQLQLSWKRDTKPIIFTIGYEGLTIDAFLYKLIINNVMVVIDVRHNPHSMKYGFSKKRLNDYIEKAGMKYINIPELGIPSSLRKGLGTSISHEDLFRKFETDILPNNEKAQNQLLSLFDNYSRVALVCFEADYHFCHRNTLIEYLQKKKHLTSPILHL